MVKVPHQLRYSAFSAYHENYIYCAKITDFQFEDPSSDEKLSIKTLMEEVRPFFMER